MTGQQAGERYDTVVIGGGQAGLAVGHHLARARRSFVILDAQRRVGDAWRSRWDGLRLFTAARYDGLPGMPFPAPPDAFPTKDEAADYLETYAAEMRLPVETGIRVDGVWPSERGDGFRIAAGGDHLAAARVVVATGAYSRPRVPAFATELDPEIRQLHSSEYRNASQLRDGPVLVVGASNSGAEVAMTTAGGHRTVLSGPDKGTMPVRPESRLARVFDIGFWFFINHVATLDNPLGRKALPMVRDHGGPLERVWPADLEAAGVERITQRMVGVRDGRPVLADGRVLDVANVIWCTGFRPDFGWIRHPDVVDADGWPLHVRGISTTVPGLAFVGLPFLHSAASALLGGVGRDARHVVDELARGTRPVSAHLTPETTAVP
ncbi:MAG TPA: NAD(P)-binding domain-containing protein [Candidatus Limnocylindrales bacterium]